MARSAGIFLSAIVLGTLLGGCRLFLTLELTPSNLTLAILEQTDLSASWNGEGGLLWESSGGSVLASGTDASYTAPASAGSYLVTVRSAADPTLSASAAIEVLPTLSLSPAASTVEAGAALVVGAQLNGSSGLAWQASGGSLVEGEDSASWTAPTALGVYTVTATSTMYPEVSASAALTVVAAGTGPDLAPPGPASLTLTAALGEPAAGSFTLGNVGDADLSYALTPDQGWLEVTPLAGTLAPGASVAVTVSTTCTALGSTGGQVAVASNDGSNGSATVAVTLGCNARLGAPNPTSVALGAEVNQSDSAAFVFANLAAGASGFAISGAPAWLTVTPASGSVAAGASQSVTLATSCGAGASSDNAIVTLSSDAPGDTVHSVTVTRSCTDPPPPPPPPPSSAFEITLVFSGSISDAQTAVFQSAADRWAELIVGDVPDTSLTKGSNACGAGDPAFSGPIDDVVIYATVEPIDGPGNILGSAGPCYLRSDSRLTSYGIMRFDSADVGGLGSSFEDVILHEMGHVLGIGTLWNTLGLLTYSGGSCQSSSDPSFSGSGAVSEWQLLGGGGNVPVEDGGGSGTKCGHWDEETFDHELMTGYLNGATRPISRLTVASLADLGYQVALGAADGYELPACTGSCLRLDDGFDLGRAERIMAPRFLVDEGGGVTALD